MPIVLLVDDDSYRVALLRAYLEVHGYTVLLANVASAVEVFACNLVDVVVLDCHVEGSRPIAALLRRLRSELPIIMLSGYCPVPCERRQDATVCLQKSGHHSELLSAVRTVLRRRLDFHLAA